MSKSNPNRPAYVTNKLARQWQKFVDKTIRSLITRGKTQEFAVDRALDLRDEKIKAGQKPPKR